MAVAVGCGMKHLPSAVTKHHHRHGSNGNKADHQNENDDGHLIFALIARQMREQQLAHTFGEISCHMQRSHQCRPDIIHIISEPTPQRLAIKTSRMICN